ncbi:MAG: rhodanese-like domain-containing protein [Sulfurimonas sp.]|uniref:rhodanese-like domain-containing protein n=1 Tax=Sulfurimonas sp. TaxID=2022749 RepID=UPI0028CD2993|nr:rhodanese-like domain-containing protein [Sulfurimonas sp.]MDT8338511.1 rhodanese-like domain-containing protein [Sulfurimonas sp.]
MKKVSGKMFHATLLLMLLLSSGLYAQESGKMLLINEAKKEAGEVTPEQLKEMIEDEEVIILDVRETEQRAEGYLFSDFASVNTISITRGNLEWEIEDKIKDKETPVVTYCRNGGRGALAAQTLKKMGYKNAKNLKGGIQDWAKAGYSVKTGLGVFKIAK